MSDYDFEPRQAPSIFLRLKKKGDKVTIRIASSPYREPKVWKIEGGPPMDPETAVNLSEDQWMRLYGDPDYNITEAFHWVVLDRADNRAKIFTGTPMVYKGIKKYSEMDDWGDPTSYDFMIERTEAPGQYYSVTALPNKQPLTNKDTELIETLVKEVPKHLPAARLIRDRQIDYFPEMGEENAGESTAEAPTEENSTHTPGVADNPTPKSDVKAEDIGGEPINLDDIPF